LGRKGLIKTRVLVHAGVSKEELIDSLLDATALDPWPNIE
jgi:hypothetical protein